MSMKENVLAREGGFVDVMRAVRFAGWSSPVARQAHNLKVPGSNPGPATNFFVNGMTGEKPYQVYILQNVARKLYIGLSENVTARLDQHNSGVSHWTCSRGPWSLLW